MVVLPPPPHNLREGDPARFDLFVRCAGNDLGWAMAKAMAGPEAMPVPLWLHGSRGVGKSFLLRAAVRAALDAGLVAGYFGALELADAARGLRAPGLRRVFGRYRLLAIDDADTATGLAARDALEFLLGAARREGLRLLFSTSVAPAETRWRHAGLDAGAGHAVRVGIGAPDARARETLLRAALGRRLARGCDVPADLAIAAVAAECCDDGHDCEAASGLLAARIAMRGATDEAAALDLCRPLARRERRVTFDAIKRAVSAFHGVSVNDLMSSRRTGGVVRPRQIAMYLAKTMTPRSLPEIGRRFGGRDHTTVLHAVRKIGGLIETDKALADDIAGLARAIRTTPP